MLDSTIGYPINIRQWYPIPDATGNPHHSLTCNVIDGSQMIIMGGTFPLTTSCDSPNSYGMHNLDLGKQGVEPEWAVFQPNITTYEVPAEIVSAVGGGYVQFSSHSNPADC